MASPVREAGVKHVEFVALGHDQALAVLVGDDGSVENRLMPLKAGVTPSTLTEASNFLNARHQEGTPFVVGHPLGHGTSQPRPRSSDAAVEVQRAHHVVSDHRARP